MGRTSAASCIRVAVVGQYGGPPASRSSPPLQKVLLALSNSAVPRPAPYPAAFKASILDERGEQIKSLRAV